MRLTLLKEHGFWRLSEVLEIQLDFMRMAADDAALGDFPEGRTRLYPPPMAAKEAFLDEEFINDWKEYVSSDLEMSFASDVGTFLSDLDEAKVTSKTEETGEKLYVLDIPLDHGAAWFSTFNQARLMMDLKYQLHPEEHPAEEVEVVRETPPAYDSNPARIFVLMRYEFYAYIQEWLVQHVL